MLLFTSKITKLSMTPDKQDTGEHWLSLTENVLAGDTRSQTVVGFLNKSGTALRVKNSLFSVMQVPANSRVWG